MLPCSSKGEPKFSVCCTSTSTAATVASGRASEDGITNSGSGTGATDSDVLTEGSCAPRASCTSSPRPHCQILVLEFRTPWQLHEELSSIAQAPQLPCVIVVEFSSAVVGTEGDCDDLAALHRLLRIFPVAVVGELRATQIGVLELELLSRLDCVLPAAEADVVCLGHPESWLPNARTLLQGLPVQGGERRLNVVSLAQQASRASLLERLSGLNSHLLGALRRLAAAPVETSNVPPDFNFFFVPKVASLYAADEYLQARGGFPDSSESDECSEASGRPCENSAEKGSVAAGHDNAERGNIVLRLPGLVLMRNGGDLQMKVSALVGAATPTEMKTLAAALREKHSKMHVTIFGDGLPAQQRDVPAAICSGVSQYKWHRRWEQVLMQIATSAVPSESCMRAVNPPPYLLELFLSCERRTWCSTSPICFIKHSRVAYAPGPAAMRALACLPRVLRHAVLYVGIPVEDATTHGMIHSTHQHTKATVPGFHTTLVSPGPPTADLQLDELITGASLIGLSVVTPPEDCKFTQSQVCDFLGIKDSAWRRTFCQDHIHSRYLAGLKEDGYFSDDATLNSLQSRHLDWAVQLMAQAIPQACLDAGIDVARVDHITTCTSTGYLLPGLTAYAVRSVPGLRNEVSRTDIVGMGCHAGLNCLQSACRWAEANPGKFAIACGVEVCSAAYIWGKGQQEMNHMVVNSLFGDGCFAVVVYKPAPAARPGSRLRRPAVVPHADAYCTFGPFLSRVEPSALDDMIYRTESKKGQFFFELSEEAPYHVGWALTRFAGQILGEGVPIGYLRHWVVHTGGKTVVDAATHALGCDVRDLRHTAAALRKFGNQSSASFMFAFSELLQGIGEKQTEASPGDLGAFVTMGPGAGFEFAMWQAGPRFSPGAAA